MDSEVYIPNGIHIVIRGSTSVGHHQTILDAQENGRFFNVSGTLHLLNVKLMNVCNCPIAVDDLNEMRSPRVKRIPAELYL